MSAETTETTIDEENKNKSITLAGKDDPEFSNKLLIYYQRFFPFDYLYRWLGYGSAETFHCREFSLWFGTGSGSGSTGKGGGDEFVVRYQCYSSESEFRHALSARNPRFDQRVVERMEIGPKYSCSPDRHTNPNCTPEAREFVLDVDMDEYNSVRNCCEGSNVCSSCWVFMTLAVKVLDSLLRREFGFQHLLWVFSGRRGVHCWVSDAVARQLSKEARHTLLEYLSVARKVSGRAVDLTSPLLPPFQRVYDSILLPFFESRVLVEQDLLRHDKTQQRILATLPEEVAAALTKEWSKNPEQSSAFRWDQLKKTLLLETRKFKDDSYATRIAEIVFEYTYPRLDVKVSEDLNHLLKSPFCIHPKTGFVSIPVDPNRIDSFDPLKASPSLQGLISGLDHPETSTHHLLFLEAKKYMERQFLLPLERETQRTRDIEDL